MNTRKLMTFILFSLLLNMGAYADEKKILFVSAAHSNKVKVTLMKSMLNNKNLLLDQKSESKLGENIEQAKQVFDKYDLVVFDAVTESMTKKTYTKYQSVIEQSSTRFLPIKAPENSKLRRGLTLDQANKIFNYYDNGGRENLNRLLQYIEHKVFLNSDRFVSDPIIYPRAGIYHPDYTNKVFDSLTAYKTWKSTNNRLNNKTGQTSGLLIGLFIARANLESVQTHIVDQTIRQIEDKGGDAIAIYYESRSKAQDYLPLLQENGTTIVDVFINFRTMHYATKRREEFEGLGKPVLQALTYFTGSQEEWEQSLQGISANMMAFTLVLPETAGVIEPTIIAAVNPETHASEVIDYQLEYLIDLAIGHGKLAHKSNREKKLTVMFWGDRDMGASFLNVPDSLHTISHRLHNEGYQVEPHEHNYFSDRTHRILDPFYRDYELDVLLKDDLAELLPLSEYKNWLATLPEYVEEKTTSFWGKPEDNFMVVKRNGQQYFVIPRIRNGNMIVMRQPPRGDDKDQEQALYHTSTVPVNHYYLAAYYYARQQWQSDAIVHLGTHGSQEYLPGKERGLSRYDSGNLAVGTVPVVYPFIVDDVGEAMQTKRRGNAVVISHMTPPYAATGLQGVMADIHELMHQYKALDEGGVKEKTGQQIIELCITESICKDFGWSKEKIQNDFAGFLVELHDYMAELAAENQPLGLHNFGELAEKNLIISTVVQMLGDEFIDKVNQHETDYYQNAHNHDSGGNHTADHDHEDEKQDHHHEEHSAQHGGHFHESATELEQLAGFKTVRDFVLGSTDAEILDEKLQSFISLGKKYYNNMKGIKELDHLVDGLAGKYIPIKTGGDPVRHPESLPTGLNLYGFDPSRLPTKAAYQQGEELVEKLIADYYEEHGRYPDKMAFSLWSIEAMRHYGVLEGQAMKAMGIRPEWSKDGRVIDTEIIPYEELKRPRVDVVLSATGLYRDAFPNVMQRLAKAIQQVAELKEDNNSLWDNSQKIKSQLLAEGVVEDEAQYLSTVRIFSNVSGAYDSGVSGPVFKSDTWESDEKIANNYLNTMGYYFGADDTRWGQRVEGLYGKQLSGTDVVAFSRSSNLYGMITSDDPFEYFGSLALVVRALDGKSPQMMISNLRDAKNGKMESAEKFMAKELRTRNFNKRWIQEMQKEGYSGAVTMSSSMANFWGWQVVDPNIVRADQWQEFFEIYVEDKLDVKINEWLEEMNPASQAKLIEWMLEAVRKNYWPADDKTQQKMLLRYTELMNRYDLVTDNEKMEKFVQQTASGFGLNLSVVAPASVNPGANQNSEQVQGQQLEKVEVKQTDEYKFDTIIITVLVCLLFVLAGAWRQAYYREPEFS